jgi:hypothetical protein
MSRKVQRKLLVEFHVRPCCCSLNSNEQELKYEFYSEEDGCLLSRWPFIIMTAIVALMMEAAGTSETFHQTTRCKNPKDSHLHSFRRNKLKSL